MDRKKNGKKNTKTLSLAIGLARYQTTTKINNCRMSNVKCVVRCVVRLYIILYDSMCDGIVVVRRATKHVWIEHTHTHTEVQEP